MTTRIIESDRPYYCDFCDADPAKPNGCTGHKLGIEYQSTADIVTFVEDGEAVGAMDYHKAKEYAKLIDEIHAWEVIS